MTKISIGDTAPNFILPSADGQVGLADYRGKQAVVLYFYPKNGTPVCTREACHFRDAYEDFTTVGAEVIGVSTDSAAAHAQFSQAHKLPFVLLSDKGGALAKQYGVGKSLGLLPGRVTFVIDKTGTVRHVFNSQFAAQKHVNEALQVLRDLD